MAIRGAKKKEEKPLYRSLRPWFFNLSAATWMLIISRLIPYLASLWNKAQAEYAAIHEAARDLMDREIKPLFEAARKDDEASGHGDMWLAKNKNVSKEEWLRRGKTKEMVKRMFDLRSRAANRFNEVAFKLLGYEQRESEARERATQAGYAGLWDESHSKVKKDTKEEWIDEGYPEDFVKERIYWIQLRKASDLVFRHQNGVEGWLTGWRSREVSRSLEEETLKMLHGANLSYLMLRLAGDKDAKMPEPHEEEGFFYAVFNRKSFSVNPSRFLKKDGSPILPQDQGYEIVRPCKKAKRGESYKAVPLKEKEERKIHANGLPEGHIIVRMASYIPTLVFLIPEWNKEFRGQPGYQRKLVDMACQFRQVTISRRNPLNKRQEADLSKPGGLLRFTLSLDIPKPQPVAPTDDNIVYVSVGGTSMGIKSKKGREVIILPVPDKAVRGIKANGELRGIDSLDDKLARCQKGSKRWKMLTSLRQRLNARLRNCGKHNVCNIVKRRKPRSFAYVKETIAWHGGSNFAINKVIIRSKEGALADKEKPDRRGVLRANYHAQNADRIAMLVRQIKSFSELMGGDVFEVEPPTLTPMERKSMRLPPKPGQGCNREEWLRVKRVRKNNRRRRRYAHLNKIEQAWLARKK